MRVLVTQSAVAASAANATGARAERKRRALVNCIVDVWFKVVMILTIARCEVRNANCEERVIQAKKSEC